MRRPVRLAVRAAVLRDGRLLMVNAYSRDASDLWCLPGGGVEPGASLPENLVREVAEETGLQIAVGAPVLVSECHDASSGFQQVDLVFRAKVTGGAERLADPEGIVDRLIWVDRAELAKLRHKPAGLAAAVWGEAAALYNSAERMAP